MNECFCVCVCVCVYVCMYVCIYGIIKLQNMNNSCYVTLELQPEDLSQVIDCCLIHAVKCMEIFSGELY